MKKYILFSFLFLSLQFWAQNSQNDTQVNINKGQLLVGLSSSNFNFQYILDSNEPGQNSDAFYSGDLNAYYFVKKNVGLGAFVSYRYNDFLEINYDKRYYIVVGPQLRMYFNSKSKTIPFLEVGGGYINFLKIDTDGFLFSTTLGSSFFLNKNIAIDAGINFTHSNYNYINPLVNFDTSSSISTNSFGFLLGLSLIL